MKRYQPWFEEHIIYVLAGIAFIGLILSTVLASLDPNPLGFTIEPDSRPLIYDLCLAYLAGVIFHFLVVVLPERRKRRATMIAVGDRLTVIAREGLRFMSDLEIIARCPRVRPVTKEHVFKVMSALNENEALEEFMSLRLSHSRKAYDQIVPYMASLPPQIQLILQRENRSIVHHLYNLPNTRALNQLTLRNLRAEYKVINSKGVVVRKHHRRSVRYICDYLDVTQELTTALSHDRDYFAYSIQPLPKSIYGVWDYIWVDPDTREEILSNRYKEYPPTAFSDLPMDKLT